MSSRRDCPSHIERGVDSDTAGLPTHLVAWTVTPYQGFAIAVKARLDRFGSTMGGIAGIVAVRWMRGLRSLLKKVRMQVAVRTTRPVLLEVILRR